MSLQLKKSRGWKVPAASGAAILIGGTYLILKSFPHLQDKIYNYITGYQDLDETADAQVRKNREAEVAALKKKDAQFVKENPGATTEHSEESPIGGSIVDLQGVSVGDVEEWSNENLKSWLKEKEITVPSDDTHDNLVSLVKSIKEPTLGV